jgi:hypothetical protein
MSEKLDDIDVHKITVSICRTKTFTSKGELDQNYQLQVLMLNNVITHIKNYIATLRRKLEGECPLEEVSRLTEVLDEIEQLSKEIVEAAAPLIGQDEQIAKARTIIQAAAVIKNKLSQALLPEEERGAEVVILKPASKSTGGSFHTSTRVINFPSQNPD